MFFIRAPRLFFSSKYVLHTYRFYYVCIKQHSLFSHRRWPSARGRWSSWWADLSWQRAPLVSGPFSRSLCLVCAPGMRCRWWGIRSLTRTVHSPVKNTHLKLNLIELIHWFENKRLNSADNELSCKLLFCQQLNPEAIHEVLKFMQIGLPNSQVSTQCTRY